VVGNVTTAADAAECDASREETPSFFTAGVVAEDQERC
jgi:hypothetical protein